MAERRCSTHGAYYADFDSDGCPACAQHESDLLEGLAGIVEAAREAADEARQAAGDYRCPHCLQQTLLILDGRRSTVCWRCHTSISEADWQRVLDEVRAEAERKERVEAAVRARSAAEKKALEEERALRAADRSLSWNDVQMWLVITAVSVGGVFFLISVVKIGFAATIYAILTAILDAIMPFVLIAVVLGLLLGG